MQQKWKKSIETKRAATAYNNNYSVAELRSEQNLPGETNVFSQRKNLGGNLRRNRWLKLLSTLPVVMFPYYTKFLY